MATSTFTYATKQNFRDYFPTLVSMSDNKNPIYNSKGNFHISNKISKSILSLPMHPYLEETDIEKISKVISKS